MSEHRCTSTVTLYDPAALRSRTPKDESVKAQVQCTLQDGHESNHAAVLGDTKPENAILLWQSA